MSTLREVKDRIASVRSTLKITSAMKLVASSKLRKAQRTIEALRPYEEALETILAAASGSGKGVPQQPFSQVLRAAAAHPFRNLPEAADQYRSSQQSYDQFERQNHSCQGLPLVVLAFSSNSSMCGAFNTNVIKKVQELQQEAAASGQALEFWAFGKKMYEFLRKNGAPSSRDFTPLVAHPEFAPVAGAAEELRTLYESGRIGGALLVYNHFVSTGRQQVVVEPYLGFDDPGLQDEEEQILAEEHYIIEPSRAELLERLAPQVMDLKLYAALLDSAAAEHAARMVAMQAATDNGESLLSELTLEYNKGRQQKITSEILDLVAGAAQ